MLAGYDKETIAFGHVSRIRRLATFRGRRHHNSRPSIVSSEIEEPLQKGDAWAAAEVPLTQRDEAGEDHDEVRREVMRLQSVEVEEISKERAGGEVESTLEVSEENNPLASTRVGHELGAGDTPLDFSRHLAGANQSLDGGSGGCRAFPTS